jgi:hypothetical protein
MNRRLEGWRLGLAVLVPALILAAAIWFLLQAVSGDDNTALDTSNLVPTSTPVATSVPESAEVASPTPVPSPTPLELPTPLPLPSAEPTEVAAEPTAAPTTAPAPTSAPSQPSQPSQPAGPTPTPTVDPSILVVTCSGASFPISVDVDEAIPQLLAVVTPAEAASNLQFLWNFGNNTVAGAPNSGNVTYSSEGTYTITLAATDRTTQEVTNVTCGTVNVGTTSGGGSTGNQALTVSCQVRPAAAGVKWEDATVFDQMRVTVSWTPADTVLDLQYEFPIPEPIIFSNEASSGDNQTYIFTNQAAVARIFWRNQATGDTGRTSCPAFSDPPTLVTPVPTTYSNP